MSARAGCGSACSRSRSRRRPLRPTRRPPGQVRRTSAYAAASPGSSSSWAWTAWTPPKACPSALQGYRRLLETKPEWHRRITFLQIAAESRTDVAAYRDLRAQIEQEAGSINSAFSEPDWMPLRLVARAGARGTVAGYMRAARVGLVTPLRDGMNLVAKEFIAAQNPGRSRRARAFKLRRCGPAARRRPVGQSARHRSDGGRDPTRR